MSAPYYKSKHWYHLRKASLLKDNYTCVVPGCGRLARVVDPSRGGTTAARIRSRICDALLIELSPRCANTDIGRRSGGPTRWLGGGSKVRNLSVRGPAWVSRRDFFARCEILAAKFPDGSTAWSPR